MKSHTKNIILVGGGGHCKSCIEVIRSTNQYNIKGILDIPSELGKDILGIKVIGNDDDYDKYIQENCVFLITVGQIKSPNIRIKIYDKLKKLGANLETIVASTAYVSKDAVIGEGNVIMHHSFINSAVTIGCNNIINTGAILEHDVTLGDHNHISTKTVINGNVTIGSQNFIGSNTCIANGVCVPNLTVIGAGSLVLNSILNEGTYIGQPAKKVEI